MSKIDLKKIRKRAWVDPLYFIKHVYGWKDIEEKPHREMIEFILGGILNQLHNMEKGLDFSDVYCFDRREKLPKKKNKFILVPRNTFKTSLVSGLVAWLCWRCPDIRILVVCETYKKASDLVYGIKTVIKNNKLVKQICVDAKGEYLLELSKDGGGDTERQFILKSRKKLGLKEPTVWCEGADGSTTGQHPNVIFFDDLVSITNIKTEARRNTVEEVFLQAQSLAEINSSVSLLTGTRYHNDDLYGRVLANNDETNSFDLYVRPAITNSSEVLTESENGTTIFNKDKIKPEFLYFPSHLDADFLEEVFYTQGIKVFSAQYQLDMLAAVENSLPFNHIHWFEDGEYDEKEMLEFSILSDFAYVKSKTADKFAVVALGLDENADFWIPDIYAERDGYRAGMINMVDMIVDYYSRVGKKIKHIVTEVNSSQRVVSDQIKDLLMHTEAKRLVKKDIFYEHSPRGDKRDRIMLLEPRMRSGRLHIHRRYKQIIIDECKNVATGQNGDDVLDAICKQLIFTNKARGKEAKTKQMTLEERVIADMGMRFGKV